MDESGLSRLYSYWERDKNNPVLCADLLHQSAQSGAVEIFQQVIAEGNCAEFSQTQLDLLSAEVALKAGLFEQARAIYLALCEQLTPDASYGVALCDYLCGDFATARKRLLALCEDKETSALHCVVLLIRCEYFLEGADVAWNRAATAVELQQNSAELLGLCAILAFDTEQYELASQYAQTAIGIESVQHDALLSLASLAVYYGDYEQGLVLVEQGIQHYGQSGRFWMLKGQVLFVQQDLTQSVEVFNHAVTLLPDHIGTWHLLGWNYLSLDQVEQAHEAFTQALSLNHNFAESHGALATVLLRLGQGDEARTLVKKALRLDPNCLSALYAQCLIHESEGNTELAESELQRLLQRPAHLQGLNFTQLLQQHQGQ